MNPRNLLKQLNRRIRSLSLAVAVVFAAASPANALLSVDEVIVGYDAFYVDGVFGSLAFEVELTSSAEEVTASRIRLPDGSTWMDLSDEGDGDWGFSQGGFLTEGDRNTAGYTTGTYRIEFTGTSSEIDFIDVVFGPTNPTGVADIASHSNGQTGVSLNPTIAWTCVGCAADSLGAGVTDAINDNEVFFLDGQPVGPGSINPGPLNPLTDYLFETEILNSTPNIGVLSDGGLTLNTFEESLTVNIVNVSTVPEPGTAAMLAAGLAGMAGARRRHRC